MASKGMFAAFADDDEDTTQVKGLVQKKPAQVKVQEKPKVAKPLKTT